MAGLFIFIFRADPEDRVVSNLPQMEAPWPELQALTPPVLPRRPSKTIPVMEVPGRPQPVGNGPFGSDDSAAALGPLEPPRRVVLAAGGLERTAVNYLGSPGCSCGPGGRARTR